MTTRRSQITHSPDSTLCFITEHRLQLINEIAAHGDQPTLIITSPPYNIGKEYEEAFDFEHYLEQQRATIEACAKILADNGSICWQVGHYLEGTGINKEAFPLDLILYPIFKSFGLKLKNRIVWTFGHGLHEKYRFSGRHETILWFVKSDNYIFNLDPIRIPQKYPGKRSFRGQNKGKPSGNPEGKNPSDVWDMPNVKANHVEKTEHPCQFPLALVERFILSMTNPNDLVLDPYLGSGTTVAAAIKSGRRSAGSDTKLDYLHIASERVKQAISGTLPYRDMNKPVYTPDPNTSVATVPEEWLKP
ncbi:MAG: site-specific DNA-methyltransferase [Anaerolineaceae bacterium]|nr:site-specific DNA-methyltransferase [Anaerolineaceae bacterium]